jgi:N-acetylglutamate synthase-like GNAT family acetyltransferase
MRVKDLAQVVKIQEAITKTKITPEEIVSLKEHIKKAGTVSFVAVIEGQVKGFVISEIMTNSFGIDQGGWIKNLGVHPKHMGEKLGQTLASHLFQAYKKKNIFEIYTAARWDSVDLLSFFKSIGFDRSDFINLYKKIVLK